MKRICLFILLGLFTNILTSCSNDPLYTEDFSNNSDKLSGDVVEGRNLTLQQAMNNLNFIARNIDGKGPRRVESVDLLQVSDYSKSGLTTMSSSDAEGEVNQLAYVVNFANNDGYAILGADAEMPPVLALVEEGSFSTEDYLSFLQGSARNLLPESSEQQYDLQRLQYMMVTSAIVSAAASLPGGTVVPIVTGRDTTVVLKCWPLVKTKWNQNNPYNYYAPIDPKTSTKSYAGCVPTAAAQTLASLAYHQNFRPTAVISNTYTVDWEGIAQEIFEGRTKYSSATTNALKVASLIRAIGEYLDAEYSAAGTSAHTSDVVGLFSHLGLKDATYKTFSADDAFDMIVRKQLPLLTRATGESTISGEVLSGHAFVLDGWLRLEYTYDRIPVGRPAQQCRNSLNLVHCNFGYSGRMDGYYVPGAFDLSHAKFDEYEDEGDSSKLPISINYHLSVSDIIFNYQ